MRICALLFLFVGVIFGGCETPGGPQAPNQSPESYYGQLHTLAFGGDTVLARRMNSFVERHGAKRPLEGVAKVLSSADLAVVNLECIIASSGEPADKDERASYYFRGRPELVRVLTEAGVDVASYGNNHAGDYGPEAMIESLRILRDAGVDPVGGGRDLEEAMAPVFRKVGDVVVAFISMDMTQRKVGATEDRAGPHYVPEQEMDDVIARARKQVHQARRYAHLVFFLTHWGRNYDAEPNEAHREMARRLVRDAGIDALLGSSAHQLQGVEIIDGKPIIYDAGNLLFDFNSNGWTHKTAIFNLHFDREGVKWVEIIPVRMRHSYAEMANDRDRDEIIERMRTLSEKLGTKLWIEDGRASFGMWEIRPRPSPRETYEPPKRGKVKLPTVDSYDPNVVVQALPKRATPFHVEFEGGFELLGYEMPRKSKRRKAVRLVTYWKTNKKQTRSYQIFVHVEPKSNRRIRWRADHQPGDWMYPTTRWAKGAIIRDSYHLRPPSKDPTGPHEVFVGLYERRRGRLKVLSADKHDGEHRVHIGDLEVE